MKKVIIATDIKFWFNDRGNCKRIASLCDFLVNCNLETIVYFVGKINYEDKNRIYSFNKSLKIIAAEEYNPSFLIILMKNILKCVFSSKLIKFIKGVGQYFIKINKKKNNKIKEFKDFYSKKNQHLFQKFCSKINSDIIIIEYIRLAYLIQDFEQLSSARTLKIIDTHDVMHKRYQDWQGFGINTDFKISRNEESEILSLFDIIIAIQDQEANLFKQIIPKKLVVTVGVSLPIIPPKIQSSPKNINISFIGTESPHNSKAIIRFIETVWLNLFEKYGNQICLNIFGKVCHAIQDEKTVLESLTKGVRLRKIVERIELVYQDSDIMVNPIYFGSGLKIKNVEALCYSKPLITTNIGAEGLENGINKAFWVCNESNIFFKKLSVLIEHENLREELAQKAYFFALDNFTKSKAYQDLKSILNL